MIDVPAAPRVQGLVPFALRPELSAGAAVAADAVVWIERTARHAPVARNSIVVDVVLGVIPFHVVGLWDEIADLAWGIAICVGLAIARHARAQRVQVPALDGACVVLEVEVAVDDEEKLPFVVDGE